MDLIAGSAPPVGAEWKFGVANIPANTHSLTVELYDANGGIIRLFPRGRATMEVTANFAHAGSTLVCAVARDSRLNSIAQVFARLDVGGAGNPSRVAQRSSGAGSVSAVPIMGTAKPASAFGRLPNAGGTFAAPMAVGAGAPYKGINISVQHQAWHGEIVDIYAAGGEGAVSVRFTVANASIFGRAEGDPGRTATIDITGGSAKVRVEMHTVGTSEIRAEFLDGAGRSIRDLTRTIEVVNRPGQSAPAGDGTDLTSLIKAKTDALMNRLKR